MPKADDEDAGKTPAAALLGGASSPGTSAYFAFMLVSTAFRSYEAGIISSQMPAIVSDLHLTYTAEGFVAAASDYGLLPSSIVAMVVLTRLPPHDVLRTAFFVIAVLTLLCALFPSCGMLIATRALTSLLWGMAAVHYPAWVGRNGSKEGKTMQLAVLNSIMLAGILAGYLVGGIARSVGIDRWALLYGIEAPLMLACTVGASFFDRSVAEAAGEQGSQPGGALEAERLPQILESANESTPLQPRASGSRAGVLLPGELEALLACPLYVFSVAMSACISGVVGFILYFMTQVAQEAIGFDKKAITPTVAVVFVLGPLGGNIGGGWLLSRCGGYQNYVPAFRLVLVWVFLAWAFSGLLPVAAAIRSPVLFTASIFGLLLFGAAPIAAINGAAVSAVPGTATATYGSGVQFFCQHAVKMAAPMVGGWVIDQTSLGMGFSGVVIVCGGLLNLCALGAYWAAKNHC